MHSVWKRMTPIFLGCCIVAAGVHAPINAYADNTVYITEKGTKYHLSKSCRGLNNASKIIDVTFNQYIDQTHDPCKICVKTPLKVSETRAIVKKAKKKKNTIKKVKVHVSLSNTKYTYNGKKIHPAVSVYLGSNSDKSSKSNYTVKYSSGCRKVGTYKVKVKMKGRYKGTGRAKFKIIPQTTAIKSLSAEARTVTMNWNKRKTQVDGYQIQYSTDSDFIFDKGSIVIKNRNSLSTSISEAKRLWTYYFRARTYKESGGKRYYSDWSEVRSIRVPFLKWKKAYQEFD